MPTPRKRSRAQSENSDVERRPLRAKIVGIGGAGITTLGSLSAEALVHARAVAVDTDGKSAAPAALKLPIGESVTRGLSASGDPTVGRRAADADAERLREILGGADLVIVLAGLGGGTASGAAPAVAQLARQSGALTIAMVYFPFEFEPSLRRATANNALVAFRAEYDATLVISLDRLFAGAGDNASVDAAFRRAESLAAQAVGGLLTMLTANGINPITLDQLRQAWGSTQADLAFGSGFGPSAWEDAQAATACDTEILEAADQVFVQLIGSDLKVAESMEILRKAQKSLPHARISLASSLQTCASERRVALFAARPNAAPPLSPQGAEATASSPPLPRRKRFQQQTLALITPTRGHFEDTEATIYAGEDLDVPTYLRKGVRLE